jgi:hypothetical protein
VVWVPIHRRGAISANGWVNMTGERLNHDVQLGYRVSSMITLVVNGRNIFNRQQRSYFGPGRSDIVIRHSDYGAIWTMGVRGAF